MEKDNFGWFERLADGVDTSRRLVTNFSKLAFIMSKGAYLVEERRRLFEELGRSYFDLVAAGKIPAGELETTIKHIERLSKKIDLEEILIRQFRFGYRRRTNRPSEPA